MGQCDFKLQLRDHRGILVLLDDRDHIVGGNRRLVVHDVQLAGTVGAQEPAQRFRKFTLILPFRHALLQEHSRHGQRFNLRKSSIRVELTTVTHRLEQVEQGQRIDVQRHFVALAVLHGGKRAHHERHAVESHGNHGRTIRIAEAAGQIDLRNAHSRRKCGPRQQTTQSHGIG